MEILSQFVGYLNWIWPFLFILTVIVFIHELGHFLVARWCGVTVKTFSVGFGREIFGFDDSKGTRWRFAWVPLGGYVKFLDDENAASVPDRTTYDAMSEEERQGSFQDKSVGQRAAIVAAGPIANFILAIGIFAFIFATVGQRTTIARVDEISANSAAQEAGFEVGDVIFEINNKKIDTFAKMQQIVSSSPGEELSFKVKRNSSEVTLLATPKRQEITDRFGNKLNIGLLGIRRTTKPEDWTYEQYDPLTATGMGVERTWFVITSTLDYIRKVIVGSESANQLGGPIRIAQVSGQVATDGWLPLLNLTAILSISIGLLNLFPVPMLDGGHLLFYFIEFVRGRPLNERTQEFGFRIGLALVLMLMIFATWNDLVHLLSLG
ncbi:MAG: RIP metalloprotease RseP [Methyloligellaceae bacterium]